MKSLYTSRNNSFNQPIFQSKLLELLSRNYKNNKKITLESLSFRQKLSTSKISHTNSYINSNTNTNTNSLIKQSGNNTKRKKSKQKKNINSTHKFSMSNDNFNEFNKKRINLDVINTIYTSKTISKNKKNHIKNMKNNKRSKSKNSNYYIKNQKSSKVKRNKKMNINNKIMINIDKDLSLKKENQILKLKIIELQNEYEKLKNENDLLISQNRNQNPCLSKQKEIIEIPNEKINKKINKLSNNLNLIIDNLNNYPCDYFNIINTNTYNNSPIHDYINSNKKIYNNHHKLIIQDKNILSYNNSKNNINLDQNVNYFTIGNSYKNKTNNSNNSKILNSSKNKIILSMSNIKNIKKKLNKNNSRLLTQNNSYTKSILNTEKFITNLKKNKIKDKLKPQQLKNIPNNKTKNENNNIIKDNFNCNLKNITLKKGISFKFNKNSSLSKKDNQDEKKVFIKNNIKNIIIKKIESNKNVPISLYTSNNDKDFNDLKYKMENIYQRANNLLLNYDNFIENYFNMNK